MNSARAAWEDPLPPEKHDLESQGVTAHGGLEIAYGSIYRSTLKQREETFSSMRELYFASPCHAMPISFARWEQVLAHKIK
ncbi:hypothetical protein E4U57_006856 [Claviceps arundinis]|uniref:Uncharacterized protein n=1 Tax=Claviceps arundinis TaxID=1623583 RepID=A0A9P7SNQ9_9HYPO|nr:hypothetical protein E4U57_006856 [Claviceps arundinis]KAG5966820.1 hypothetical protein E4U56_001165 [Claviceps arundinis]